MPAWKLKEQGWQQGVKAFLKRGAAKRLHLEQLPCYAPDLNPDEGIWNYLKWVELGNVCCRNAGPFAASVSPVHCDSGQRWIKAE